ncbi:MAG: TonB-dependent receptor, plug [Moraxellaceae bacterium]|jgi:outer membrane receptor protein involved in Fe transport|nr:TonB-dependent receptor, plug [Moraxellaceae bacterium]
MKGAFLSRRGRRLAVALLLLGQGAALAVAAPVEEGLLGLSLSELIQIEVSTASIQPSSVRKQPGSVTVFTAEDMATAGARTLQDVLLLVPGVSYGVDVFNVPGLMFRGTWAHEGKILFLVDDIPVNDLLFGIYAIPPDFPVEMLHRVEVLRGPGGAKYGENAELAVVRIYTRNSVEREGFAAATVTAPEDGSALRQLSAGDQWRGEAGGFSAVGTVSAGSLGGEAWRDAAGVRVDNAELDQESAQLALRSEWKGTRMQFYFERFRLDAVQRYGIAALDQRMTFEHANLRLEHDFRLASGTTLTPRWTYRNENTWHGSSGSLPSYYELPAERHTLELEARHGFGSGIQVRAGLQQYWAEVEAEQLFVPSAFPGASPANYFGGRQGADYNSFSVNAETEVPLRDYLLSLGARYTDHSESGDATVPRLALTRAEADWHVKAMFDTAYREPQFETSNQRATDLKPEYTTKVELEAGHALGGHHYVTASVFEYKLRDAIVFSVAPNGIPGYINAAPFRGRGLELQWLLQYEDLQVQANYQRSHTDDDAIGLYDVLGSRGQSLGASRDIVNLWLGWQLGDRWSLHPRLRYQGARSAYVYDPAAAVTPSLRQARLEAELGGDLSVRYRRWPWTLDVGVQNVTDEQRLLPQPYSGISPPIPADGREAWLRLQYEF